jgi:K+-sensing histidine kinase KdpD
MNGVYEQNGDSMSDQLSPLVAAAHELKSPLALIRQLSLMLDVDSMSLDERQRIQNQITLTSEQALRLTSDLTKSTRLDEALFELEPVNPQQLCEDVVHELTPLYKAHDRGIRVIPYKRPLLLVANRDLLKRIMINFSDNALHYTDEHEIVELQTKTLHNGSTVRLGVRDYGPALPIDLWRTLRHKLAVAPQPVKARPQSSGLGLHIADNFARVMNGRVGVTRHRDGATFFVDLQVSCQLNLL